MARDLLALDEATERLRPFARRYLGIRPIRVDSVVGTDSRVGDFDRDFRARRRDVRERRRRVAEAFPDGNFPPILAYKLGDAYFVIDGHHRVALARQQHREFIDAEVIELTARWHLDSQADPVELRHAEQERLFMAESGLAEVRPDVQIRFSEAVGYRQLLETIQVHGYGLMVDAQRPMNRSGIALDWYSRVYLPTVELLRDEGLYEAMCPGATESDRFLWAYEQRRELSVEHGPQQLAEAAYRALESMARRPRGLRRLIRRS
jgi:hypothetical protein